MPSTVQQLFAAADLAPTGPVRWCEPVPETKAGVYVVALTHTPWQRAGTRPRCPPDLSVIQTLLSFWAMEVDGKPAPSKRLGNGSRSTGCPTRPCSTSGARRSPCGSGSGLLPDAAGRREAPRRRLVVEDANGPLEPVRPLRRKRRLRGSREGDAAGVRGTRLATEQGALHDPARPVPFANREDADRLRKRHGITKDTGPMPPPGSYSPVGVCPEDHG